MDFYIVYLASHFILGRKDEWITYFTHIAALVSNTPLKYELTVILTALMPSFSWTSWLVLHGCLTHVEIHSTHSEIIYPVSSIKETKKL